MSNVTMTKKISQPVEHRSGMYAMQPSDAGTFPCIRMEASYLVETAVALPFFAACIAGMLFFFQVLSIQQEVGNALLVSARELSVLLCEEEVTDAGGYAAAKGLFIKNLPKDSAAEYFVRGGRIGISLAGSDLSGEYIVLRADYGIRIPAGFFGRRDIPVTQRIKCRKWAGRTGISAVEDIVYLTPSGDVYHRKKTCSYLTPVVHSVNGTNIAQARNADGGKYYPCSTCIKRKHPNNGAVYITKYGDRYHSRRDCRKIKHTILAVRISEAAGKRACSKCGRE